MLWSQPQGCPQGSPRKGSGRSQPLSPTWALNNPSMQPENAITRPRGALLWFRTGFNVVVPQAFRLLNIATAT